MKLVCEACQQPRLSNWSVKPDILQHMQTSVLLTKRHRLLHASNQVSRLRLPTQTVHPSSVDTGVARGPSKRLACLSRFKLPLAETRTPSRLVPYLPRTLFC